jgi:multidrug efflux pump subunit AcrB
MVDVFVEMPGATPADVEQRVTRPLEQLLWEVPGVEYVYSTSSPGQSMVVVRFTVDEPQEAALVRLNQKLAANADRIPPGVIGPIVSALVDVCRRRHGVVGAPGRSCDRSPSTARCHR